MSSIEKLLNEAETLQDNDEWELIPKYLKNTNYSDDDGIVNISGKTIDTIKENVSVQGEQNSQYIEFVMDRFFDGVDLASHTIAIHYETNGGGGEDNPVNVYKNDSQIKFGWVIGPTITQQAVSVQFCIWVRGTLSDGKTYVWKTLPQIYPIKQGLVIGGGIPKPDNNWYVQFSLEMDAKVTLATESADAVLAAQQEVTEKAAIATTQYEEIEAMHSEVTEIRDEVARIRDEAEQIQGIGVAEVGKLGVSKPDGETIDIDEDGTLHCKVEGSKNYQDLENKPKINGVELDGDKSLEDLGFEGTTDYQVLENKPSIAGIELSGDKSYDELGLAGKEAVVRSFETVNQEIQSLDEFTKALDKDISTLDGELETVQQNVQSTSDALLATDKKVGELETGLTQTNQTLQSTTDKVDTVIAKADLGIKETATGEEIHLTDSAEGKAVEFALYGKAKQNTTTGKNLLENTSTSKTSSGITYTVNENKSVVLKGTNAVSNVIAFIINDSVILPKGTYKVSCFTNGGYSTYRMNVYRKSDSTILAQQTTAELSITLEEEMEVQVRIIVSGGATVDATAYPMISADGGEYEPYTNGASPNPDYPQPIEVSGASYNLLENTATSQTINGVEFVVNEDGSVFANGLSNEQIIFSIGTISGAENVILSGCAKGGSDTSYLLQMFDTTNNTWGDSEYGNGKKITLDKSHIYDVHIVIRKGVTIDNLTFYPMIRKASVKNDRYMPYGKGSVEVKSCGKNLLKNFAKSQTVNGVTFTIENGIVTANGTSTNTISFSVASRVSDKFKLPIGKYILSGCPSGGSWKNYLVETTYTNPNNTSTALDYDMGDGKNIEITESMLSSYFSIGYNIVIQANVTLNNLVFKPMIRLATDTDNTYQPYKESKAIINGEFAGIKVSSNGNYTDQNGQQWICDEIVKYADGSGERIQKVKEVIIDSTNSEQLIMSSLLSGRIVLTLTDAKRTQKPLCNMGIGTDVLTKEINKCFIDENRNFSLNTNMDTLDEFKAHIANNPLIIYYELAEPIHTPLTAEEIAEISTFYPITNISNDAECGMRIEYVGDSIITTNTEIPIVEPKDEEELESGDNIVTLFGKIKKKLKNVGKGVVDVVDNLLSTSTTSPLSANQGRVLNEKITTLNESVEGISKVVNEQLLEQMTSLSTRLSALEQKQKTIIYSDTEPETVEENTIVMVYETEE